jgi:FKBP-type peptidyl-prolyl cis-trans isomerase SlpA
LPARSKVRRIVVPMQNKGLELINLLDSEQADSSADKYAADEIGPGKQITMHFSLALQSKPQELIDDNFSLQPVSFSIGDGNLLPGFEEALFGLRSGDERKLIIAASEAFGERNEDNIQRFPRFYFPADLVLEKGLMINFSDAAGNEQTGVIQDYSADEVSVDFNHPLAGHNIIFRVAIKTVACNLQ